MIHPLLALMTAGLVAINQYIPLNQNTYIRYVDNIKELKQEDIFPAAHQSCNYLISSFIDVGLKKVFGNIVGESFGNMLKKELNKDNFLDNFAVNMLLSETYAKQLKSYNLKPQEAISFIQKLCGQDFSLLNFTPQETQAVFNFIKSEIHVLNPNDFKKIPRVPFFGSIPLKDRNKDSLGTLYTNSRAWVNYNELSNHLVLSLIAAEDQNFFLHDGVDINAVARIAKQFTENGSGGAGGSTLSMQLLKNFYFNNRSSNIEFLNKGRVKTVLRKVREWYWAKEFERSFQSIDKISGKKKILEHYFNLFDFGHQIHGVHQASRVYFSKTTQNLSLGEAAYIVTLFKGPYLYSNPKNYKQYTQPRRNNYVLNQVADVCSNIAIQAKHTAIIFKNLCKDEAQAIDSAYIQRAKQSPLPVWSKIKQQTQDFLIPLHRQAKQWLNKISFEDSPIVKELSLQTSIDKNLQKLVFKITKEYLDKEDKKRNTLSQVKPARNDKGGKAKISITHLPSSVKQKLDELIKPLQTQDTRWLYSLRLSPHPQSNSLNEDLIKDFFKNSLKQWAITQNIQKIKNMLNQTNTQAGHLTFIKLTQTEIFFLTLNQFIKEVKLPKKDPVIEALSPLKLKNQLFKNALLELYKNRSREYLEPALYLSPKTGELQEDLQGILIDKNLKSVKLSPSSQQALLQNVSYQPGDFFWLRLKDDSSYSLESEKLQAAVIVLDSHSGDILANFDGYNPKNSFFYRSSQSKRQPGSTIKPFTYLYALDKKNFQPHSVLNNSSASFNISNTQVYKPKNFSNQYTGDLSLFKSFVHSQNIATANLILNPLWGPDWRSNLNELNQFFEDIELYPYDKTTLYPSVILGSKEITLSRLAGRFSVFANGQFMVKPIMFKQISNYKDETLYYFSNEINSLKWDKKHSLLQLQTLLLSAANIGTSARLNSFVNRLAGGKYRDLCYNNLLGPKHQSCLGGKTGTSNNNQDLWFIGFSKNFIIGIWMGYDVPKPIGSQSSALTLPLFENIIEQGLKYLPPLAPVLSSWEIPPGLEKRKVSGALACSDTISSTYDWIYAENTSPINQCLPPPQCTCKEFIKEETNPNVIKKTKGYTLDIFYKNNFFNNNGFYKTLKQCEEVKKNYINSVTKEPVCPL